MFYSHTYLARKGPLGTVWCAAHLQHKLKKSHYASTDIHDTVDRIMFPEVPLALRMSGHLLLGVVRIYSKKVEYLHEDCNLLWVSLKNAFKSIHNVNLPHNATQAPLNAITLPDTFALDSLHLPIHILDGSPDNHLRAREDITLTDQYHPFNNDLYVRITFDDDIIQDSSNSAGSLHRETETMQIDTSPRVSDSDTLVIPDPNSDPKNPFDEDREVMRDRDDADYIQLSPVLRPHHPFEQENKSPLREPTDIHNETPPSIHHISTPLMQSPPRSGPSSPALDIPIEEPDSFVATRSTELLLRPSPSPERPKSQPLPQPQPQSRQRRKRKQLFDEALVLSNAFIKKGLNDPSDLVRKRRKLPSSSLETWKVMNKKKKEMIFIDPLISGMCTSLQILTALNPNSVSVELGHPYFTDETERIRSPVRDPIDDPFEHMFSSPPRSPLQRLSDTEEIPTSPRIPSMVTDPRFASTANTDMDTPMSGAMNSKMSAGLSDIPEWRSSPELDDLMFLEQDNNSPCVSLGVQEGEPMSVRTRALVQYLKYQSPLSDSPVDLSLNAILDGRSRKSCARMFYETLVLKTCNKIDVKQDEAYADITLKLIPESPSAKL